MKIKDKHLVFTGKMERGDRDDMKEEAVKLGAIVQSDVNSKTDLLICGKDVAHNSKNTKRREAEALGTKIIDEDTYIKMISDSTSFENNTELDNMLDDIPPPPPNEAVDDTSLDLTDG